MLCEGGITLDKGKNVERLTAQLDEGEIERLLSECSRVENYDDLFRAAATANLELAPLMVISLAGRGSTYELITKHLRLSIDRETFFSNQLRTLACFREILRERDATE